MRLRQPSQDPGADAGVPEIPQALRCPPAAPEDIAFWADKGPPPMEWVTPAEHAQTSAHTNWRQARKSWAQEHNLNHREIFRAFHADGREDFSGHMQNCPHPIERD
jgi:hypothetical protein